MTGWLILLGVCVFGLLASLGMLVYYLLVALARGVRLVVSWLANR